ncbi:hypothetical protein BASA81_001058 [Batrachochytrium salamandrivorans]|nr:hypothetical protein BASA81_001058 [Batrachochytrium salamandrivorans]
MDRCKVLGDDLFSLVVNCMLGAIALSSLLIKRRYFDKLKRTNRAFCMDVSKLFVSGTTGHLLNVAISQSLGGGDIGGDECAYYLVNYLLDFVFGVPLTMYCLNSTLRLSHRQGWTSLQQRGYYNDSFGVWVKQTLEFTGVVAGVKVCLALPLFAMQHSFAKLGGVLVTSLQHDPQLELFVVMLVVPTLLNVVQFVVYDQILMLSEMEDEVRTLSSSEFSLDSSSPSPSDKDFRVVL